MVSPALFPLLRTAPHLGRLFVEEDARDVAVPAFQPGAIGLNFPALGRLRPGVSPERAAAEADTVLNADRSPSDPRPRLEAAVIPLQEEMVRGLRPALALLSAVTALVLVIACINVAGVFLAHGIARRRKLAVRGAQP